MPGPHPETLKLQFAVWVAADGKVATWCQEHGVAMRTAYRWYKADWFKRLVEALRRRAMDRAVSKMVRNFAKAVEVVVHLASEGQDDRIRLSAARTCIDELLRVRSHAELKAELRRLHRRLAAQEERRASGPPTPAGAGRPS